MKKPAEWMALGALLLLFGVSYTVKDNQPLGAVAMLAGVAALSFGLIAEAVKLGVRAARDEDRRA